ncbi:MAG: LuxR C-terminal-related transcriptional regulator [Flavobacteriaceae bacterium]
MNDKDYYSNLYAIASQLNKEFSLRATLRKSLEKTLEILEVDTGWIWLTEADNTSVYLAASQNLPPALSNHPERLSGWCYCIKQYLSDEMDEAMNISEITCSRLQDIGSGTKGLKFHATIPITVSNQKVGLINLLSKETQELNEQQLTILNTIGELIGTAIQRARLQQSYDNKGQPTVLSEVLNRIFTPKLEALISGLKSSKSDKQKAEEALKKATALQKELTVLLSETAVHEANLSTIKEFNYPETPLSKRELEVLTLIKKGLTNEQIGKQLFITERTVKFHVTAILSKLAADNRTEAVDIGLKKGFF